MSCIMSGCLCGIMSNACTSQRGVYQVGRGGCTANGQNQQASMLDCFGQGCAHSGPVQSLITAHSSKRIPDEQSTAQSSKSALMHTPERAFHLIEKQRGTRLTLESLQCAALMPKTLLLVRQRGKPRALAHGAQCAVGSPKNQPKTESGGYEESTSHCDDVFAARGLIGFVLTCAIGR
eukprot:scaffold87077_cov15-Tisochrysis_lutea.AAC.1